MLNLSKETIYGYLLIWDFPGGSVVKKSILDPKKVEGKNKEQKSMQTPNIKWRQSTKLKVHSLNSSIKLINP